MTALWARCAAGALRFASACLVALAGLLVLALALASVERSAVEPAPEVSASAYLDFDLAVLRGCARRSLGGGPDLRALWQARPDWKAPPAQAASVRLVSPREAWSAAASPKSRFRTAVRGVAQVTPFLFGGLALSLCAAALAGALALTRTRGLIFGAAVFLLVAQPLFLLLDPGIFYDRTRSLGQGFTAALFVAAFAGAMPFAAARALWGSAAHSFHLSALFGRRAWAAAARLAVLDATDWLVPLTPALAAAAVFVCAKGDQDAAASGTASGLGALIRAAVGEPLAAERIASSALAAGALVLLWFAAHRFLLEVRASLGRTA